MNGYKCFGPGRKVVDVNAESSFEAQKIAAEKMGVKPKARYQITVVLCEKNGAPVAVDPASF